MHDSTDPLDLVLSSTGPTEAIRRLEARLAELYTHQENATLAQAFDLAVQIADIERLRSTVFQTAGHSQPWQKRVELPAELPPAVPPPADDLRNIFLFLGRGVSGRLGNHRFDPDVLERTGLPFIAHPANLAEQLAITPRQVRWLAFHAEVATRIHYVQFAVPRRSGGTRTLSRPLRLLDGVQHWILGRILSRLPVSEPCHGFVAGRSIVSNATPHAGKDVVINLDLENFFPTVTFPRVRRVFERAGYSSAVSTVLALLCTESPRRQVVLDEEPFLVATGPRCLPQGACTSPALANQVALRLDRRLGGLARRMDLTYTRYADDLTFSGPASVEGELGYILSFIERIVLDEGFAINAKKTRILRQNSRQTVTGLVVNDRPGVPRKQVRRLRAILHRARTEGLEAQNREGLPNFRAWLMGKIAYVRMVRPAIGEKLLRELKALHAGETEEVSPRTESGVDGLE